MCSLKIHDNVLLSRVFNECDHHSLYVGKVTPVNKIHTLSCKKKCQQGKSSKFKLKQQSPRTTSTLLWCLTSYHIK